MALSMFKPGGAEKRALSLLDAASPGASLRDVFKGCDDETWLWALTEGRERDARLTDRLPELPEERFQKQFTGRSGRAAFDQAIKGAPADFARLPGDAPVSGARALEIIAERG